MHFNKTSTALLWSSLLAGRVIGRPTSPNPMSSHSILSYVLPAAIAQSTIEELRLASYLENLEVSFFETGAKNLTHQSHGYTQKTVQVIGDIAKQEKIHASTIQKVMDFYDLPPVLPCNYTFPANSAAEFLELANLIETVGIGATNGVVARTAEADPELVRALGSIATVESRHDAFLRSVLKLDPAPTAFDTGISAIWAYNLAHEFIEPGSCPDELPIPILPGFHLEPLAKSTQSPYEIMEARFDPRQATFVAEQGRDLLVGWVSQVGPPIYSKLNMTEPGRATVAVPSQLKGVVFAAIAVEKAATPFDLARQTLAGPVTVKLS